MTDKGNVFFYDPYDHRKVTKGDVDAAFEKADVIVKGSYRPSAIEQAPIEPQGCLVVPESDGRLTVYTCTQAMYFTMGVLAEHLQRTPGSIKLVGGTVGGGFGGKVDSATEPLASRARAQGPQARCAGSSRARRRCSAAACAPPGTSRWPTRSRRTAGSSAARC